MISETFKIGNSPGEYPAGDFIQDKTFVNYAVKWYMRNYQPLNDGYGVTDGKMYFDTPLTAGEIIVVICG